MTEKNEYFKQLNVRCPKTLYEKFHRVFPGRGMKQAFFLRLVELAVEKGANWSMVKQIEDEVEEKYGGD